MLAGLATLRVGAGRLTLAVGRSVAAQVAVAVPECGVVPLDETPDGHVSGAAIERAASDLSEADAVVVGPGLDDAEQAAQLLHLLPEVVSDRAVLLLDAFALGVLSRAPELVDVFAGRLILTPNRGEASRLLERDAGDSMEDVRAIADRYSAVVSCFGSVCDGNGGSWRIGTGTGGLATSGSGDVLAGAIAGLSARGASPAQAAVWGTHIHSTAGDRLAVQVAPLGYLARELLDELPRVLVEIMP
jgi:hydroxyethylthiazole kinase-like uncharacterized protein yjeF